MADNTVLNLGTGGDTIATDDIGGVKYQIVKLATGALDTATLALSGSGTATGAIRVELPTNGTGVVGLNAGTNAIGKLAANSGVDIGDVDVTSSALPTGASTAAKQDTGNTSLSSIDGKITAVNTGAVVVASGSITADTELTTGDLDTGAGTDTRAVVGLVGSKSGGGVLIPGDATKGLAVDLSATGANATALKVDGSAATQPVSGTVTAAQATAANLNMTEASAANILTSVQLIDDTIKVLGTDTYTEATTKGSVIGAVRRDANTSLVDTTNEVAPLQVNATGELKVAQIQALPAGANAIGKLAANAGVTIGAVEIAAAQTLGTVTTVSTVTSLTQMNGAAIAMGTGTRSAGTQRVTVATDDVVPVTGTFFQATQPVSIAGTVVVDDLAAAATAAAVPTNAQYQGLIAKTSLPAAGTDGNLTGSMGDKYGRMVVIPGAIRDLVGTQTTTISASTSETTIVTAAASVFNDLTAIVISNTSATAARVDFRDTTAGSVLFSIYVPAGDVRGVAFNRPIPQTTINTNWTAQSSASITDLRVYAVWDKNR